MVGRRGRVGRRRRGRVEWGNKEMDQKRSEEKMDGGGSAPIEDFQKKKIQS